MKAKEVVTKLEEELSSWRTRLGEMRVQANLAKMELRDKTAAPREKFELAYDDAKKKLGELADLGGDEVDAARLSLRAGWEELRKTWSELAPHRDKDKDKEEE